MLSENNRVLFSVLIANYNNAKYLEEALQSVFEQTYTNWEIILVDDGSTDNSREIYEKYKNDSRIKVFYNEGNKGVGYTKRRCAELANGEICGFLDPDDALLPNALKVMVEFHLADSDLSMVYSRYNEVNEDMSFISVSQQQKDIPNGESFLTYGGVSQFVAFKTSAYRLTSGIDSYFQRAVDHNLYYKLEEVGRLKFVDRVLYNYRQNTGQNVSICGNEFKAYMWHMIAMVDACKRRGLDIERTIYPDFENALNSYSSDMVAKVRDSHSFRLGNKMVKVIKKVTEILKMKWLKKLL